MQFCALNIKTEYSMLESMCSIKKIVAKAANLGYSALAMTDIGNMHGVVKFYEECLANNIKPIIGLEISVDINEQVVPIYLYAKDNFGYLNLMRLASASKINNDHVSYSTLSNLASSLKIVIPFYEPAWSSTFIDDVNYKMTYTVMLGIIDHLKLITPFVYAGVISNCENNELISLIDNFIRQVNLNKILTDKITYINSDDKEALQVLKAIKDNYQLDNQYTIDNYLINPSVLSKMNQELLEATYNFSKDMNVTLDFDHYHMPKYSSEIDAFSLLKELCYKGLAKRIKIEKIENVQKYEQRLVYELETIHKMGFDDYFLIVWDFVKYAKTNGIYVGPGRGSAPASLVSYTLGITDIDPIKHQLLFERFLNCERITMPDIDIDFPDDRRDEVIKYVGQKYGKNHVAHIVTFGTLAAKSSVRDVAKVLKLSEVKLKNLQKCISDNKASYSDTLAKIYETSEDLIDLCNNHDDIKKVVEISLKLEGLPRNTSTHAAGIVMTEHDLTNYVPIDKGLNEIYQTQYEASDLEKLGILKTDFLGLRNLSIIKKCVDLIKQDYPTFTLPKNFDDQETFKMIASGETLGVFQLESDGMRKVLQDLKVSSFTDVASAIALYRPGPMEIIPTFVKRKLNLEVVTYPHKDLEPILRSTYGTIVYQDQIILIAWKFAGYTLGEADILRRAVSKKKKEVLEKERVRFIEHSIKKGYSEETATEIYDYIVKFANYGFNKAHAVSYAVVAYLTAYLKCHYPAYYFCTLTSSVIGADSMMETYLKEMQKHRVKLMPPHVNISGYECVIKENLVYLPLSVILGVGSNKQHEFLEIRANDKFKDYEDFVIKTKDIFSGSVLENIIYSGALDCFGLTKKAMVESIGSIINKSKYAFISGLLETEYTTEEYPYGYLLEKEKSVLGINIVYNFLHQYESLYETKKLLKINQAKVGANINTLGIIKSKKDVQTSKGEWMCIIKLKDSFSEIEAVLFPRVYAKNTNLSVNQVYQVYGRVDKEGSRKAQIIVEEMKLI